MVTILTGCEQIYSPEIESRESVMVADARIVVGDTANFIRLYESRGFNEKGYNYPNIAGAAVSILDNKGNEFELNESSDGIFPVHFTLNNVLEYKIRISFQGNTFESTYEPVPQVPELDTVYGIPEIKYIKQDGNNDVSDIREVPGLMLYADITNDSELPFYKFTARKVLQYIYPVEVIMMGEILIEPMFAWLSSFPNEMFNIAAPPEFSTTNKIIKQPLFFMAQKVTPIPESSFYGWILILYQQGLSESGYNYYNDLNKQLDSEGKLFDPIYVQARSNLKCINDSKQLILGNFEISSKKEYRYFINFISEKEGYLIKPIPYFYEIPGYGEQITTPPDFWETASKIYPNE